MIRKLFFALAAMMFPAGAFAVDGVVLINESIINQTGGFPHRILRPGSYRLSGNVVAPADQQAIQVAAPNVVLDLNGFGVTCSMGLNITNLSCIGELPGVSSDVSIRNGTVIVNQTVLNLHLPNLAVGFIGTPRMTLEDLHIVITGTQMLDGFLFGPTALAFGGGSIIRHNIISGQWQAMVGSCPSLIAENVVVGGSAAFELGLGGSNAPPCVLVNNIPSS